MNTQKSVPFLHSNKLWEKLRKQSHLQLHRKSVSSQNRLSNFTFSFHFHALEKEMAAHSSVLAWRIPGTGEPGELPSMWSHRVGHHWSDLAGSHLAFRNAQLPDHFFPALRTPLMDFSGGPVVKNPPANAGDLGSIPGLGSAHATRQLSSCTATTEAHTP